MREPPAKLHVEDKTIWMIEALIYDRKHFLIIRACVLHVVVVLIRLTNLEIVERHTGSITVNVIPRTDALLHKTPIPVLCVKRVSQGIIFRMRINLALSALVILIQLLLIIALVHVIRTTTIASTNSTSEITNVQLNDGSVSYTCMIACEPNQYAASSAM